MNVSVKQESIPVGCAPPTFLVRGKVPDQPPMDADPRPPLKAPLLVDSPVSRPSPSDADLPIDSLPLPHGQTNTCENITLQTSFVGAKFTSPLPLLLHRAETSKNSDNCDLLKVSDF